MERKLDVGYIEAAVWGFLSFLILIRTYTRTHIHHDDIVWIVYMYFYYFTKIPFFDTVGSHDRRSNGWPSGRVLFEEAKLP